MGHRAKQNGLIHTFFRPSDDLQQLPYLIPAQFFAFYTLNLLKELVDELGWTKEFTDDISKLISDLNTILFDEKVSEKEESLITFKHPNHGMIYAYEINGFGEKNFMDDSNIPSLLSLPYICPEKIPISHKIYRNTRSFVLSKDNPWYFEGKILEGKSIHFLKVVAQRNDRLVFCSIEKVLGVHIVDNSWLGHWQLLFVV